MVDPRLPEILPDDVPEPPEVGGGDIRVDGGSSVIVMSVSDPGRGTRVDVGDRDTDFERVLEATAAFSASRIFCRSRPRSLCKTAIARS